MSMILNRRSVMLGALGTLALAQPLLAQVPSSALTEAPFTLGVSSGDPAVDGFVIWTRLALDPVAVDGQGGMTGPVAVKWIVYDDETLSRPVLHGEVMTDPASAHSVHVELAGLRPDRHYWYRFEALGARSRTGRGRTLPLPHTAQKQLNLAFASCSHWEQGYFSAYRHMAEENPDYVMFLGDYIYENAARDRSKVVRLHDSPKDAVDLTGYRNRHALYHTDPDLQLLHASVTCLTTWDDHDVQNDYAGFLPEYMRQDSGFPARRMAAYQAFYEHMPLRRASRLIGRDMKIYKGYRFGTLAEINMLDGRQYRSPPPCPYEDHRGGHMVTDSCVERLNPAKSFLGFDQEAWLYQRFAHAEATWNILGQDQLMAPFHQHGPDESKKQVFGYFTDGWDGFPAARDRLIRAMQRTKLKNPVVLSGDIHSYWASELKVDSADPESAGLATEFVGTSITRDGPAYQPFADDLPGNPHMKFFDSRQRGYVSVIVRPERLETRFQAISDRTDPNAAVYTRASFVVENGRPKLITTADHLPATT